MSKKKAKTKPATHGKLKARAELSSSALFGGPFGCPCALNQDDLDKLTGLLKRGIQHKQIGVALWTGRASKYGTVSHKIPSVTRCNGTVELNISTEGFQDMLTTMWKDVISQSSCEVELRNSPNDPSAATAARQKPSETKGASNEK